MCRGKEPRLCFWELYLLMVYPESLKRILSEVGSIVCVLKILEQIPIQPARQVFNSLIVFISCQTPCTGYLPC